MPAQAYENPVPAAHAYQFPSGHLGHLSDQQASCFEQFKKLCQERGAYKPAVIGENGGRPSHDDATLLRFLRARKFQLDPAYDQFKGTEQWRETNRIKELYETIDVTEYDETRKLYPQWVGRRDKHGMPVYLFQVGSLTIKQVQAYEQASTIGGFDTKGITAAPKLLRLFALYEALTRFVNPWSTAVQDRDHATTPITQGCNIVDITGVGMKQFWDLKAHLQDSSQLATAHYPETLDKIFIIGAPSWFPTIWKWIKGFFDPIVVGKMFVLAPSEVLSTLQQHIEHENIPKQYGGGLDYTFGDMPLLDKAMVEALGAVWGEQNGSAQGNGTATPNGAAGAGASTAGAATSKRLPIGPIKWEEGTDGRMRAVAVGTVKGRRRSEVVLELERMYGEVFYPQHRPVAGDAGGRMSGDKAVEKAEPPTAPTSAGPVQT